ncbi:unnamed protein product [Orchesella dallaii]|uniref:Uncharacterized protein n=1 Tax=Orchesella dallaii TaxID=48710 RepID=A0ABP1PY27_9HEXA
MAVALHREVEFEDLVQQWTKVNSLVPARPLLHSILAYCQDVEEAFEWGRLFDEVQEQARVVLFFRTRMTASGWGQDAQPDANSFSTEEQLFMNYLNDKSTVEFAFIATVMIKLFDLIYSQPAGVTASDVLGDDAAKALGNLATSSLWLNPLSEASLIAELDDYGTDELNEDDDGYY